VGEFFAVVRLELPKEWVAMAVSSFLADNRKNQQAIKIIQIT
jgi:hypothetical protein